MAVIQGNTLVATNQAWTKLAGDCVEQSVAECLHRLRPADILETAATVGSHVPARAFIADREVALHFSTLGDGLMLVRADDSLLRFRSIEHRLRSANQSARAALQATRPRAQWGALMEAINNAPTETSIVVEDANGHIISWNRGAQQIYGYSPKQAIGQPIRMLNGDDENNRRFDAMHEEVLTRGESTATLTRRRKDGSLFLARAGLSRMTLADGTTGYLLISRDVSEEARREEEERRLRIEKEAAEHATRVKTLFLANMSHELRTPLNSIIGFAELLQSGRVKPEQVEEFCGDIHASAKHLHSIINDILDLTKVEAGRLQLRPEPLDVAALCNEVVMSLRPLVESRQQHVDVHVDVADQPIMDSTRLKQILYNYFANAVKFTQPGGRIAIRLEQQKDSLLLEVEDNGPGIPKDKQGLLFTAFEQLDPSTIKRFEGTGLGLALVKQLVSLLGGEAGVESVAGEGSTFWARLPFESEAAPS